MLAATAVAAALAVTPMALGGAADATPTTSQGHGHAGHPKPRPPIKLDLLAINDFHGNLEKPTGSSGRITTGLDANGLPVTVEAGGAARLATTLDELRAASRASGARTLTVAAGDLVGASPLLSGAFHDEPTIEALNLMGLDIASVGNHEFDEGWRELLRMQYGGCLDDGDGNAGQNSCPDQSKPFTGADFRYLSANVRFAKSKRTVFPSYVIRRVDGAKVAFIGMTLENTPNIVTKSATAGLEFTDEVETVRRVVPQLKRQGVKAMVVLLHEGATPGNTYTPDGCPAGTGGAGYDIAQALDPAIDVVVSGHTNAAYNCGGQDPRGRNRLLTSASSFGRLVTKIPLEIDRRSQDIIRPAAVSPATNVIVTQDKAERSDLVSLIARYNALVAPIRDQIIGQLAGVTVLSRTPDTNGGDSPLGNLIADSQRSDPSVVTGGQVPVIALMNPGGIRADLSAPNSGQVTYGAAFTVQPFNNYVTSITLTGAQVRQVLNEQWNGGNEGPTLNKILQVSGLSYTWDRSLAAEPNTDAVVGDVLVDLDGNGTAETPLDPAASYRVVVNSFLVEGGDNFSTLALGTDRFFGGLDIESLRQFLSLPANTPYTPTPTDRISAVD